MKLPHWFGMFALIVISLYLGKMFGSKLPAIPGIA